MIVDIQAAGDTTDQIGKLHWTAGRSWRANFRTAEEYFRSPGLDAAADVAGPPDSPKENGAYAKYLKALGSLEAVAADERSRYINWEYEPRASLVKPEEYHDSFVAAEAVSFIRRQAKEKPFCPVVSLREVRSLRRASPHPFRQLGSEGKRKQPSIEPASFLHFPRIK